MRILALVAAITLALPAMPVRAGADDFHSAWVDQSPYPTLAPGATTMYTIRFRNTGTAAWRRGTAEQANLGVVGDATVYASFAVNWLSANRVATTTESVVLPGAIGTFTFTLRAPTTSGVYHFPLRPVIDGVTWMEDNGVFLMLVVAESNFQARWVATSAVPSLRGGEISPAISITFLNSGTRPWIRGEAGQHVSLGVAGDDASWGPYGVGWLSANRVATTNESSVQPGATGTFTFRLMAPAAAGTYRLRLRPVIDGVAWLLQNEGVLVNITVLAAPAPTPLPTFRTTYRLGEPVTYPDGWRMTVTSIQEQSLTYSDPDPGLRFVTVFVRFDNGSQQPVYVADFDFKLQDSAGVRRSSRFVFSFDRTDLLASGDVAPGAILSGSKVFQAPVGDTRLQLIYDPGRRSQVTVLLY